MRRVGKVKRAMASDQTIQGPRPFQKATTAGMRHTSKYPSKPAMSESIAVTGFTIVASVDGLFHIKPSAQCRLLAHHVAWCGAPICLKFEVDRKSSADRQNGADDPSATY